MDTADFSFNLPEERIARVPARERGGGRLMVVRRELPGGGILHRRVTDLPDLLEEGSLVILNDSRVRKARVYGLREADGKEFEFLLIERARDADAAPHTWRALCRRASRLRPGARFLFPGGVSGAIASAESLPAEPAGSLLLSFDSPVDDAYLETHGHIPLPPYLKRPDAALDAERYQTVYARETGSIAAPTAGLHLTPRLLEEFARRGIQTAFVTLRVGLGTFLPVHAARVEDHRIHAESFCLPAQTAALVEAAKAEGRPVVAVGTTSARALESAWRGGTLARGENSARLFLYGGKRFNVVDRLFTNFHTPRSTLLMLVSCFAGQRSSPEAGRRLMLDAYALAIREGYRFFSYGDAMLIL